MSWILAVLFLFVPLFTNAAVAASDPEASRLIDEARIALAGGRDLVPARIEIEALYQYRGDDHAIADRTIIEPGQSLFQEREIDGQVIRRSWHAGTAFLEGPNGRAELDEEMRDYLELYLCRRQLEFLILCPGVDLGLQPQITSQRRVIEARRGDVLLGELEIDLESYQLVAVRYSASLEPTVDPEATADEAVTSEVTFSEYRAVEGWTLPHRVDMAVDGQPHMHYSIERLQLQAE